MVARLAAILVVTMAALPGSGAFSPAPEQGQVFATGGIRGCVTDKAGAALPGVTIVAAGGNGESKVVTGSSGCYELGELKAGTYRVTASLAGFVTGAREGVSVSAGEAGEVNFALCPGVLAFIDWITVGGLDGAWEHADVVAHVRILKTAATPSECPSRNVDHTAAVVEIFKGGEHVGETNTLTFMQEIWYNEPSPYAVGQEMVVFLSATPRQFVRLSGPFYVFLFENDRVVSFHSPVNTEGLAPAAFLAKLRALALRAPQPDDVKSER